MIVAVDGMKYRVQFRHRMKGPKKRPRPAGVTECIIDRHLEGTWVEYLRGLVRCKPPDKYSREAGRKEALIAALRGTTKAVRGAICTAYFGRTSGAPGHVRMLPLDGDELVVLQDWLLADAFWQREFPLIPQLIEAQKRLRHKVQRLTKRHAAA